VRLSAAPLGAERFGGIADPRFETELLSQVEKPNPPRIEP